MPFGCLHTISRVISFSPGSILDSSFLLIGTWGQQEMAYALGCHVGDSAGILDLAWPNPSYSEHLGNETEDGWPLFPSLHVFLFVFQNQQIWNYINVRTYQNYYVGFITFKNSFFQYTINLRPHPPKGGSSWLRSLLLSEFSIPAASLLVFCYALFKCNARRMS